MIANRAWYRQFNQVVVQGWEVAPRGKPTLEVPHAVVKIDMSCPVVTARPGLNYKFMAAEALWILQGRNDLDPLIEHVPRMKEFSDDGRSLTGAYGPPISEQLLYVVKKLREDRDTRQAVLTIWKPNPMPSKDIPCTIAMAFQIRDDFFNSHVFMRSSDVWLGLPYDLFSFTMVAEWVRLHHDLDGAPTRPGSLYVTAASSHLYVENVTSIEEPSFMQREMPRWPRPIDLENALNALAEGSGRWWRD
jgi:thymidylate synthase